MGSSFRRGIAAAAAEDHVLMALVDQPGLTPETVARVLAAHRPGRVAAAAYRGPDGTLRRGHPLLLDVALRAEAAESATGDAGARLFLRARPELIDLVDCSDQSGGEDLDTPDQLRLLELGHTRARSPPRGDRRPTAASPLRAAPPVPV